MSFILLCIILVYLTCEVQSEFNNNEPCRTFGFVGPREIKRIPTECEHIYGNVWVLTNETGYEEMIRVFSSAKVIHGCISIHNTNFENLSFFGNLEKINCEDNEIQAISMVESFGVKNNAKLKKLMMPNIVTIDGPETAVVTIDGSPQLCFEDHDTEYLLLSPKKSYPNCMDFVLCSIRPDPKITNGSQIPEGCSYISWDIVLEGDIEDKYLRRLRNLQTLQGTLTLRNSTVTNLDLSRLTKIDVNGNGPALTVSNNPRLVEIKMSHALNIKTDDNVPVLISSNPAFTITDKLCDFFSQAEIYFLDNMGSTCRSSAPILNNIWT